MDSAVAKKRAPKKRSNEFFYVDKNGNKQDAALHEEILSQGDEAAVRNIGKEVARRAGLTEAAIRRLYADPSKTDGKKVKRS